MEAIGSKHRIGGYRIIAPIGVGSSSTVFRALDEASGTEVAIKVLADNHSHLPEMRHRFVDEVELLSTIKSPAIAKIFKVGETENQQPFMVLELADRGNLRRRIEDLRRDGRHVAQSDLLLLAEHLADALGTLHKAGIVHRDVSPGNVLIKSGLPTVTRKLTASVAQGEPALLRTDERFLLIDLGFAKDLQYASGLTAGGGTRGFAAPEQRDDITVVDHRSDIYSATALLEWVAARSNVTQSANAERFEAFVETGLADDPDDRFDSIGDWLVAARQVLESQQQPAKQQQQQQPAKQQRRGQAIASTAPHIVGTKPPRGQLVSPKKLAVLAGIIALVGIATGAFFGFRSTSDEIAAQIDEPTEPEFADRESQPVPLGPEDASATGSDSDLGALPTTVPSPNENESTTEASDPLTQKTVTTSESRDEPTISTRTSSSTPTTENAVSTTTTQQSSSTQITSQATTVTTRRTTTERPTTQRSTTSVQSTTQRPTTQRPTTQRTTTTQRVTTVTLGSTTTIPLYRNSPRAYINSPASESTVSGNLTMSGTATYPLGGVQEVQITIMSDETGMYWHDSTSSFATRWVRFPVAVSPTGGRNVTWSYTVNGDALQPGRYLLRVWAQSTATNGDPVSDRRYITITD